MRIGGSYKGFVLLGLPALLAAVLALAVGLVLTGALHEDGLADCADGFVGGRTRAETGDYERQPCRHLWGIGPDYNHGCSHRDPVHLPADLNSLILIISLAMFSRLNMLACLACCLQPDPTGWDIQLAKPHSLSAGIATVFVCLLVLYCSSLIIYAARRSHGRDVFCRSFKTTDWRANRVMCVELCKC